MIKEISLKGLASAPSGHSSADGLLSLSIGCISEQGELTALTPFATALTLPEGHQAVLRHAVGGEENIIVTSCAGGVTSIMWTRRGADGLSAIAAIDAECLSFAAQGRMVAVATSQGLQFMAWRGSGYAYLGAAPSLPEIEFGMQRVGSLAIADRFEIPGHMAPSAGQGSGAGAWLTHPSAQAEAQSGEAAAKAISRAFEQAVACQADAKGLFCQPFLLRYGLRLPDGSLPWVSAPVLMCPWALPPCLALESVAEADSKKVAMVSSSSCHVFQLRRRVLSGLPQAWADEVASVDVFITPQIPAYDLGVAGRGFASYKTIASAGDSAFAGCWSESGDCYCEHTLAQSGLSDATAWAFAPSADFAGSIAHASAFYLAESIPVAELVPSDAFAPARIACTGRKAIEGGERLYANAGMPWNLLPDKVDAACGRIFAIGGKLQAPDPVRVRAISAACGAPSEEPTEVAVWIKRDGEVAVVRRQWDAGSAPDLASAFPRMLAYPCREACMMQLSQGGRHWRVALAPHPVLDCACWLGSLKTNPAAGLEILWTDGADGLESSSLPAPDCFAPSLPGCAFAFAKPVRSHAGRVRGVSAAVGSLSPGQLGQFAAYALCSRGVMALGADSFAPKQLLTSCGCISAAGIAAVGGGVAYASSSGLMLLRGWKCECLCQDISPADGAGTLPGLPRLAEMAGASLPIPSLADVLARGTIAYDSRRERLIALSSDAACAYVCSLPCGSWGIVPLPAPGRSIGGSLVMLDGGAVIDAELDSAEESPCLIVTHPIKAERPVQRKRLAAAMAEGRFGSRSMAMAVYGSNDLSGWSLVASASGRHIDGVAGSPWRYFAGALAGRLGPADAISSLTLSFQ